MRAFMQLVSSVSLLSSSCNISFFADGADVISSLRIYIQGVGIGVVGVGYFVVALCFGQVEELLCGIGGNKLKGFYVGFLASR